MNAKNDRPLFPPDESLWQKYSAHFEMPLAGMTSFFLHGLVIGALAIGGVAAFFAVNAEATRPPRMDVVMVEGGGSGFEGLGGEAGLPGSPDAGGPKRTELIDPQTPDSPETRPSPAVPDEPLPELGLPLIDDGSAPVSGDLQVELRKIAADADALVKKEMKLPTAVSSPSGGPSKKPGTPGTGNPKGVGGLGGAGGGTGMGSKKGPGKGSGGIGGRKATDQEAKAWRWRFDLSGDAKEHARKLAAIGVIVAIPDPRGGFVLITDLNRRPVELKKDNLMELKDAVKWYNTKPDSVQSLARELQLPFTPKFVVMLLPKEREQKMVEEETRFAAETGRDVRNIQFTLFDFRLRNGVYDPLAISQK